MLKIQVQHGVFLEGHMTFFYVVTIIALILLGWYFKNLKDYQIVQK